MWLFYSLLSGGLYTAESLLQRFHLRKQKDVWTFALFYSLIGAIVTFPFAVASPKIPTHITTWLLVFLVSILIVANNMLFFKATSLVEISVVNSLQKLRLVWIFSLSILLLHDSFSWPELLGTILVICAGWIILHSFKRPESARGIWLVLILSLVNGGIIILFKYLLSSFNSVSLTFFADYLPATLLTALVAPKAATRIKDIFKDDWRVIFLACSLGAFSNLALNAALSLHDASGVLVMNEAFLILVLVGEHIFLKEREKTWIKAATVALAIAGAVLIDLSH